MASRKDPFEGEFTPGDIASLGKNDKQSPAQPPAAEVTPSKPKPRKQKFAEFQAARQPDKIIINPVIPNKITEEFKRKSDTIVVLNGRMNPVTKGHEENVKGMHDIANKHNADHLLIASHSHDIKKVGSDNKNPLSPEQKLKHLRRAFPNTNIITTSKEKPSILHQLSDLHSKGYKHVILAAGGDRVEDESYDMVKKYNGSLADKAGNPHRHGYYNFDSINIESTGERKKGISGTDMRKYAESNNFKKFNSNLPTNIKANPDHAKELFNDTRSGMKLNEHTMTDKERFAIYEKALDSGIRFAVLEEVYRRGVFAYTEDQNQTQEQFAFNRVNSFIGCGLAYKLDQDLREDIDEAVDLQGRLKRKMTMARYRRKIELARNIAKKRFAKNKNIRSRALKIARNTLRKRLAGARGAHYNKLDTQSKIAIDKMLDKRRKQVKNIANKIITRVKRDEMQRLAGHKSSTAKQAIVASYQPKTLKSLVETVCIPEEDHIYFEMTQAEWDTFAAEVHEEKNENRQLNKPFRTTGGPKKFAVYVKNDKGNIIKLGFGDPNLEIKRDDPDRRKAYRARHGCDNPGPKWKANYWSCNWSWSASKKVGA